MFSSVKFSTELFVLCFVLVTSAVYAIELPKDTIIVEAESAAQMDKGVEIVKNKDASEGVAINSVREAKAVHEIDIPKPGKWFVWVRLYCPDSSADSYWIGIEGAEPNPWDAAGGKGAVKIYSEAGDSVNTAAQPFNIWYWDSGVKSEPPPNRHFDVKTAGKSLLWSKGREERTLLDQILITMDESFNVEEASKGAAIEIPKAISLQGKFAVTWGSIKYH